MFVPEKDGALAAGRANLKSTKREAARSKGGGLSGRFFGIRKRKFSRWGDMFAMENWWCSTKETKSELPRY